MKIHLKTHTNHLITREILQGFNLFGVTKDIPAVELFQQWMALPALIDPHVHFRTPGLEHKEDWKTGARAAFAGGYTTVSDMPNTLPPTTTRDDLQKKHERILNQLKEIQLPLNYGLYFGANRDTLNELPTVKKQIVGLKIFMGSSTGGLVMDDLQALERAFQIASEENILIAVHAEDEQCLKFHREKYKHTQNYADHSNMRAPECAKRAVATALELCAKYATPLYILHLSTEAELHLIRQAKQNQLRVFAEVTPHHLFLNKNFYGQLNGKALVNPPLRTEQDNDALWQGIADHTIDTIGTDHAPHTLNEKSAPMGMCPCGMPSIENTLSLLLNAAHEKKLSLQDIVRLTHDNPKKILQYPDQNDLVLVDLTQKIKIDSNHLLTKCAWTPYEGFELIGAPKFIISGNTLYDLQDRSIK